MRLLGFGNKGCPAEDDSMETLVAVARYRDDLTAALGIVAGETGHALPLGRRLP